MTVQRGRLTATDTTKDLASFYSDAVATRVSDVNRIIENGTQFVRLVLRRPQPVTATQGTISGSTYTSTPHYIDGSFVQNPTPFINLITIGFGSKLVSTTTIRVFSTSAIDSTTAKWKVQTSLNNLDAEFGAASFDAPISAITQAIVSTSDGGNQFRYTITVGVPTIDSTGGGLPYWRIRHTDINAFDAVTEVQILTPLTPTISYFNTDGSFASSASFEKTKILDAAYDTVGGYFYTIRYNDASVGTSTVTLDDNFSDADAGTASGTNNFNPSRWSESNSNTQFLRSGDKLSYNVATGKGQIETTFTLDDFNVRLDVTPTTITSKNMWLTLRALDSSNNTIMSEGVGYQTTPTVTGVWFSSRVANLVNSTSASTIREMRPQWHNAQIGTDSFTVLYGGSTWSVSGTLTGALSNATTGVLYNPSNSPIEFQIASTATPSPGEQFTFDLITSSVDKIPTATGILSLRRTSTSHTTENVITSPVTVPTSVVSLEIFGNTNGSVNISADNFDVVTGSGSFASVAVFTVEKTNSVGLVQGSPLIEAFDVIGDPSLTYNDFLNGRVQIASTSSGTSTGEIYLKINNELYRYPNTIALGTETGSSALASSTAQISTDGTNSFAWTHESGVGGLPFLTYIEYDETLQIVHLKTIDKDTLLNTTTTKELLLNISDYNTNRYEVFYDQNDFDTLYYVDSSNNLRSWNVDDRISAFMAVNASDVSLPAGTAQQTPVVAEVINAWGETLDGKTVTFAVTAGDGAISPSSDVTVSGGIAESQFTVGSTVGVSTITATVTEA